MRSALLLVLTAFGASLCFGAEVYPGKPVRVVVGWPPGTTVDLVARVMSQQLSEQLGQSFLVDNRPGASGTIGTAIAAKSAPDGYTLIMIETSFSIAPSLFKSLPYEGIKDFTPITQVLSAPMVLVVHPSVKANTLKEFVALAHENPGKLNYASAGTGSIVQLAAELFKIATKTNIVNVPYKGGGEMVTGLLGGQVQMLVATIPTVLALVKSGKLRALAVTTDGRRSPSMTDVPSMSEAGVSGMTVYTWFGFVGLAGMPKELVNKLHVEVVKALAAPSVKGQIMAQGGEAVGSSPEEFSRHIRSELQRWADVIKSAGITAE
jgi:tripartite-type tricarboxylate transporter receptor subunit TctC